MSITATELKMYLGKYLLLAETEDIYITKNGKASSIEAKEALLKGERVVEFDGKTFNNYQLDKFNILLGENSFCK